MQTRLNLKFLSLLLLFFYPHRFIHWFLKHNSKCQESLKSYKFNTITPLVVAWNKRVPCISHMWTKLIVSEINRQNLHYVLPHKTVYFLSITGISSFILQKKQIERWIRNDCWIPKGDMLTKTQNKGNRCY